MMAPRKVKNRNKQSQVTIPSLIRGLRVLEWIASQSNGVSFPDLELEFSIPKTTLFRIVKTLVQERWLEQQGEQYFTGAQVFNLGTSTGSRHSLRRLADAYLSELSRLTGETAHLVVRSWNQGLIIAVRDGPSHIRISSRPGSLSPIYCTAPGKALLAFGVPDDDMETTLGPEPFDARTEHTITDLASLRGELNRIRERGYSIDDREYYPDVRCVAAPVFDGHGNVVAAIGITAPAINLGLEKVPAIGEHVVSIAGSFSRKLGYREVSMSSHLVGTTSTETKSGPKKQLR